MGEWHCVLYGQPQGPFSEEQLREMIRGDEISAETLIWDVSLRNGAQSWSKAGESKFAPAIAEAQGVRMARQKASAPLREPYEDTGGALAAHMDERFQKLAHEQGLLLQGGWQFTASRKRRFAAFVLDIVILLAFSIVFLAAPILLLRGDPLSTALHVFLGTLAAFAVYGVINFCLLAGKGQSISKNIAGVRIVNADGSRTPLWKIIALRNGFYIVWGVAQIVMAAAKQGLIKNLPLFSPDLQLQLAIAGGVIFFVDSCLVFGKTRRTLHDLLAGTIVVEA